MEKTPKSDDVQDKIDFLHRHSSEVRPVINDSSVMDVIEGDSGEVAEGQLDAVLEKFETKVFTLEKKESERTPDAERVLLTINDPGAYNAIAPLIAQLSVEARCSGMVVLTSGVAGSDFEGRFGNIFTQVRDGDTYVIDDINKAVSGTNVPDIIIASLSSINGPESIALYAGKSVFGAKKTYVVFEAWTGLGSAFGKNKIDMDTIDGLFCNDELAKKILLHYLPQFEEQRVHVTGTPVLDSLEVDKADVYRNQVRDRFGIGEDVHSILYLGDVSADYKSMHGTYDPKINEKTFEKTIASIKQLALANPGKHYALLLRPHPRDPHKEDLYTIFKQQDLPQNVTFVDAGASVLSMNEAAYAADTIVSILSTENNLAPLRGRESIFLAYEDAGLGGDALNSIYNKEITDLMASIPGVSVVSSGEGFAEHINTGFTHDAVTTSTYDGNASKKIIEVILGNGDNKF